MKTTAERLKSAEGKAEYYEKRAQEERDEATGAKACGLTERAESCERAAEGYQEDADVWAATVGKLTAASRAEIGPVVIDERDWPDGWSAIDEENRNWQARDYADSLGYRFLLEQTAYEIDAQRFGEPLN